MEIIKRNCTLPKRCEFLLSMGFITFVVAINFVSIMMTSNVITSQTLIFFPKIRWINFFQGNSVDVKQPDVPSELAFMMKSILCITMSSSYKHYALKIVIILKKLRGFSKKKCVFKDG